MSIKKMRKIIDEGKQQNIFENIFNSLRNTISSLDSIIEDSGICEDIVVHKAQKLKADLLNAISVCEDMGMGDGTLADLGTPPMYALGSVDARGGSRVLNKENPFLKKKKRVKKEKSEMMQGGEPEISRVMRERQMTYDEAKEYLKIKYSKEHNASSDIEDYDKNTNECFQNMDKIYGYDLPSIQREIKELKTKINSTSDEREKSELVSKLQDLLIRTKQKKESLKEDFHDQEDMLPDNYEQDYQEEQPQIIHQEHQERYPQVIKISELKNYSDEQGEEEFQYIQNEQDVETYLEHVGVTDEEVMNKTPYVGTSDIDFLMIDLQEGEVYCIYVGHGVPALNKEVFKVYERF